MSETQPVERDRVRVETYLASADFDWIVDRADDMGLEPADVLRMLVRQARKGLGLQGAAMPTPDGKAEWARIEREAAERKRQAEIAAKRAELERQLAELDGPQSAGSSFSSDFSSDFADDVSDALHEADEILDLPRVSLSGPPGSLFVPTGVSNNVPRGYDKSDPRGSVMRQNYAHLGFNGG